MKNDYSRLIAAGLYNYIKTCSDPEKEFNSLRLSANAFNECEQLNGFFYNPAVSAAVKESLIKKIALSSAAQITLRLCIKLKNLKNISRILESAEFLFNNDTNSADAEFTMRSLPDINEREILERRLGEILNKKIKAKIIVKPDILGGIILKINHTVYDYSVRRYLDSLKKSSLMHLQNITSNTNH
jgi:ATP synthase F1 delta subunit